MAPTAHTSPVSIDEIAPVFERAFGVAGRVVLAVSGGADSTALMFLAAGWAASRNGRAPVLCVATVDHGLRPGSACEAQQAAGVAAALGLPHTTLAWLGEKPATGLQEAARVARYRLLSEHALALGATIVATAHTLDDQAETMLMRLARGSGLDGLACMPRSRAAGRGVSIARPLIDVPKARLVATLRARNIGWIEDPSNDRIDFERTRWRQAWPQLDALGLSHMQVARSARRLARARAALNQAVGVAMTSAEPDELTRHGLGFVELDWGWLLRHPAEIRLRILARLVALVGGDVAPPPLSQLEAMTEERDWRSPVGRTLAGVMFKPRGKGRIVLLREFGRDSCGPVCNLAPDQAALWDGRFVVRLAAGASRSFRIAALGAAGVSRIEASGWRRPPAPAAALRTLPGFWSDGTLAACPALGYFEDGRASDQFTCLLAGDGTQLIPSPCDVRGQE